MYEYHQATKSLLDRIFETNKEKLSESTTCITKNIIEERISNTFCTGHYHMIGLELFVRAGGLANVNALDSIVMTSEGARRSAEIERIGEFQRFYGTNTI